LGQSQSPIDIPSLMTRVLGQLSDLEQALPPLLLRPIWAAAVFHSSIS
jgi:hypothetical protein